MAHVVQRHGFGRILDQVGHVVHGVDELVDLLAVDRCDEGLVQRAVDFMRDAVCGALGVVDFTVERFALLHVRVVGNQVRESMRGLHDPFGMLVEHLEKIAFAGQQFAKQHVSSSGSKSKI